MLKVASRYVCVLGIVVLNGFLSSKLLAQVSEPIVGKSTVDAKQMGELKARLDRREIAQEIDSKIPLPLQQGQRDLAGLLNDLKLKQGAASGESRPRSILPSGYERPYFRSGEERSSARGVLNTSLSIVYDDRKIYRPDTIEVDGDGKPVEENGKPIVLAQAGLINARLRSYEGRPVGPTLRVKPGEILRVKLKNLLPPENPNEHPDDINTPHDFNTTNLHTHGLHVSPAGNGDNVLSSVRPGEELIYEVTVPEDHISGTFWYHAHRHGSTAMQVSSGMAGALIIDSPADDEGTIDNVPGIDTAEERICVFQQISYVPPSYQFNLVEAPGGLSDLPSTGKELVVVGKMPTGKLVFRVFDDEGNQIENLEDVSLPSGKAKALQRLKLKIKELKDANERRIRISLFPRVWSLLDFENYELEEYEMAFGPTRWRDGKGLDGWRTTVNGQFEPVIRVESGKLQRFRMIHAGVRDPITVQFSPIPAAAIESRNPSIAQYNVDEINERGMREIARDGIPLEQMKQTDAIELYPGYRSDALVRFVNTSSQPEYHIMWNGPSDVSLDPAIAVATKEAEILAVVEVMPGSPLDVEPWPSLHDFANIRRPKPIDSRDVVGLQTINLGEGGFAINQLRYDPERDPRVVQLGRTDQWDLASLGFGNHPFHIHVNPFYVVSKTTVMKDDSVRVDPIGVWKDTLLVLGASDDNGEKSISYKVLTNYKRYVGEFVLHCHILDHEDQGMMMKVAVENSTYKIGTALAYPFQAPVWTLPNVAGEKKSLDELRGGKATVLVFLQDQSCSLCNEQMQAFKSRIGDFSAADANVVFVAPKSKDDSFPQPGFDLPIVFDHDLSVFADYEVTVPEYNAALHGVFILDHEGKVVWRETSDEPAMNLNLLLEQIRYLPSP
ncbi:redoxin domain-containing protein [Roseiconus lacunae]|uniref:redoxin domain-containing protein n=1 Tax=Roseiconus lacunae TaxID=2605694 RepID=UPI0011F33C51|nr:multicopper oxidase domain-containing protein [Roseiconus lacunae]